MLAAAPTGARNIYLSGIKKRFRRNRFFCTIQRSGHLEVELVALVAVDLRLLVTHVAKRAFKVLMIVRGVVRVRRLDVLRLLGKLLGVVALDALIHVRGLDLLIGAIGRIRTSCQQQYACQR